MDEDDVVDISDFMAAGDTVIDLSSQPAYPIVAGSGIYPFNGWPLAIPEVLFETPSHKVFVISDHPEDGNSICLSGRIGLIFHRENPRYSEVQVVGRDFVSGLTLAQVMAMAVLRGNAQEAIDAAEMLANRILEERSLD